MTMMFIRIAQLASTPARPGRWPCSGPTIWRWVREGKLAPPVKLGPGCTAWPMEVIEQHERDAVGGFQNAERVAKAGEASVASPQGNKAQTRSQGRHDGTEAPARAATVAGGELPWPPHASPRGPVQPRLKATTTPPGSNDSNCRLMTWRHRSRNYWTR